MSNHAITLSPWGPHEWIAGWTLVHIKSAPLPSHTLFPRRQLFEVGHPLYFTQRKNILYDQAYSIKIMCYDLTGVYR